jgi:hypothetical protein
LTVPRQPSHAAAAAVCGTISSDRGNSRRGLIIAASDAAFKI